MNNTFAMCLTLSLSASFADHRSTLDGADKVPARELAVAQDEKDHDRDLRDYETSSRKVKHRDIAIAVQLHQTSEEHTEENRLARKIEPTKSECRNQGEQHGKCSTSACIEQAVAH